MERRVVLRCTGAARRDVDDVGFVRAALDDAAQLVRVDRDRVYATGLSNGGMMSYRLGCEAAHDFAAIAPVGATSVLDACAPSEPVSVLHVHGTADENVPFDGGPGAKSAQRVPPDYPPVMRGVEQFAGADGCEPPTTERLGSITTTRFASCASGAAVVVVNVDGGGHSWPGGERISPILDPPSDAYDATERIWEFFAAHSRGG
jgi:polyhydroxybutyrate depolymerase